MSQGKLLEIAIREKSRAPMQTVSQLEISSERGCAGDFRGKPGNRQVTVLSQEAWERACAALGKTLPWTSRRANWLVAGIELANSTGHQLSVGDVVLQITGETDPCDRMEEIAPGLYEALRPEWRGGVCCRVIQGGVVCVGDEVKFE